MRVDLQPERIELPVPVVTPVGPFDSVWSIAVTVGDAERRGTAKIHCRAEHTATSIVAAAEGVIDECELATKPVDDETWEWWRAMWPSAEERSRGADRRDAQRALCGLDGALWELVAPPRVGASRVDPCIYWSGFWLGESPDAARREAAHSVEEGFDAVKMRADVHDLDTTILRFAAIADELPVQMGIAVELAGSGTLEYVRTLVDAIDASRVLWVEDPVPVSEVHDIARLVAEVSVPIAGGETCLGVGELDAYLDATGLGMPIIDLGCCGGPSALAAFLDGSATRFDAVAVHLDATLATRSLARLAVDQRVYIEVLDWWEHIRPEQIRAILAGPSERSSRGSDHVPRIVDTHPDCTRDLSP